MVKARKEDWRDQARAKAYESTDRDLWLDLGFFHSWFGFVDIGLAKLLLYSTKSQDLEAFDILCRGLDARAKLERLRQATARHGGIGPNLSARLTRFEKAIKLRNKLSHSSITISEDDGARRYFVSGLANMPWKELGMGPPKTKLKPLVVRSIEIYGWGVWLSFLGRDLASVQPLAQLGATLEIAHPKSRLRWEDHLPIQGPVSYASYYKLPQFEGVTSKPSQ